jgi:hypothetical protein
VFRGASLRVAATVALALASACAHAPSPAPAAWHYQVTVPRDLGRLDVELCFPDRRLPARLVADDDAAARYVVDARVVGGEPLTLDRGVLVVPVGAGKCLTYGVDVERMISEVDSEAMARVEGALAGSPHLWLWRPEKLPDSAEITLAFALPDGVAASVPWPREPGEDARYRLSTTTFRWAAQVVLGKFTADRFAAAGTDFHVAVIDRPREISAVGIRRWISAAAETVALLYGDFPTPSMQVVVVPYPGSGDPVYFGMALRGGGPAVLLLISGGTPDAEFPGEWVAIHEFLHHGMPFIDHDDAWLSEGFVTYYTEVLRGRAGVRSERASWDALLSGFARGRRAGSGVSLTEESAGMHENHAYQRVYWGGAAIALLCDVALREAGSSLDAAMRHLDTCCADTRHIWTGDAILRELDRWLPTMVRAAVPSLRALAEPILQRTGGPWRGPEGAFPELSAVYRKLGVNMVDGEPTLDESASIAHVRRAIFTVPN